MGRHNAARRKRNREVYALLLGLYDPRSPVALLDVNVIQKIAELRCASVSRPFDNGSYGISGIGWYDPDTGNLHRMHDLPAVEYKDGSRVYYMDGFVHRRGNDDPAVICAWSPILYYKHGKLHRKGGPAYIAHNGLMIWWCYGVMIKSSYT